MGNMSDRGLGNIMHVVRPYHPCMRGADSQRLRSLPCSFAALLCPVPGSSQACCTCRTSTLCTTMQHWAFSALFLDSLSSARSVPSLAAKPLPA